MEEKFRSLISSLIIEEDSKLKKKLLEGWLKAYIDEILSGRYYSQPKNECIS